MRKGFSLIETLLALTSGILILGLVIFSYISITKNWNIQFERNKINNNFIIIAQNLSKQFIEEKRSTPLLDGLPYSEKILQEEILSEGYRLVSISVTVTNPALPKESYRYHQIFRSRL